MRIECGEVESIAANSDPCDGDHTGPSITNRVYNLREMKHQAFPSGVTRETLLQWFREGRRRTKEIFAIPVAEAYFDRPIALRNPVVFYEGHLPAFCINTLIKLALRQDGIDERLEELFARGIDPDSEDAVKDPGSLWPPRAAVQAYGTTADSMIERALREERIEDDGVPQLRRAESAFAILEHEQMHQETLLYMLHNLPYERKVARPPLGRPAISPSSRDGRNEPIAIPAGRATLGADRDDLGFGWDNEFPRQRVDVDAFSIDRHSVTNGDWLAYMEATGAPAPHFWRRVGGAWLRVGMFALEPLPLDAPVYVMHEEAEAYARWRGGRLPSEAEYHRAAYGTPSGEERRYPWGDAAPDATRGNFGFASWDPVPVGSYPDGASAWGVHDLVGNGWEWTSTIFDGYPGFVPMPSYPVYSSDFFDGQHYVMKGASPVTAHELIRPSFRNW
ncbi:MAG: egtB, partial [Acidobacteria bacterium]|nr:egtB [Acidobacteriota bacterium]